MLLDEGANVAETCGDYGTALQIAAQNSDEDVVQLLLQNGADVNANGGVFGTAWHVATLQQKPENAQILVDAGAKTEDLGTHFWSSARFTVNAFANEAKWAHRQFLRGNRDSDAPSNQNDTKSHSH